MMTEPGVIWIVYDNECIFCRNYCALIRVRKAVGDVVLVNARDDSPIMDEVTALGLDIDQGMVVKYRGEVYYGSDAVHVLALLSTTSDRFNWFASKIFSSKKAASVLYPCLKACRNGVLWLMDVPKINNLRELH